MLRRIGILCIMLLLTTLLIIGACKKKRDDNDNEDSGDTAPVKTRFVPKGDEGTISGVVKYDGAAPTPKRIDMGQDANCASAAGDKFTDDLVVTDGKLDNVYVYLQGGSVDKFSYAPPSDPVVLDQKGCRYDPHIVALQVNQTLRVTNSDPTTHNVHPSPKSNAEWNQSQPPSAAPIDKKFTRKETLIPVKCNQHPWMKAQIGVLDHPFFAVSKKDGTYTIKGVPPGTYTVVFWHETLGEQKQSVTVAAKETKTADLTYKGSAAFIPSSLKVEAALVLP